MRIELAKVVSKWVAAPTRLGRLDPALLGCLSRHLGAISSADLLADLTHVELDRVLGPVHGRSDLFVGMALHEQLEHLPFAAAEVRGRAARLALVFPAVSH